MANVFLVDDHPDVREVMGHLLELHGHKVEVITSAEKALERLQSEAPDVIIADNRLPGISGIELLKQVRPVDRMRNTCLVLFSADDNMREPARAAGVIFWLKGSDTLFDSIAQLDTFIGRGCKDGDGKAAQRT